MAVIDALRAVAVIVVVLFHCFPHRFPGGFIGVDIFFLISGFIIWLRYSEAISERSISWGQFYARRVRRLVPAYLTVILFTTIGAYLILSPELLVTYGWSLASQGLYLQNLVFLAQGEYFSQAIEKPLLHTWSISIEEQYYIIFPLIAMSYNNKNIYRLSIIILIAIFSFISGLLISELSERAVFYLLPFRVWEFAMGILVAEAYSRFGRRARLSRVLASALCAVALALIAASVLCFDESARMPGPQAIIALSGASILCIIQDWVRGPALDLLGAAPIQYAGRISYSWYLWHWPLITLVSIWLGYQPDGWLAGLLLVGGLFFGIASYHLIERPTHHCRVLKRGRNAALLLVALFVICATVGTWFIASNGVVSRYPTVLRPYIAAQADGAGERCKIWQRIHLWRQSVCNRNFITNRQGILLVGDSHSNMIRPILTKLATENDVPLFVSTDICRPSETGRSYCRKSYWEKLKTDVRRHKVDKVILAARWPLDFEEADYRYPIRQFRELGVEVYVMLSTPEDDEFDPRNYIEGRLERKDLSTTVTWSDYRRSEYMRLRGLERRALSRIASEDRHVHLLDPIPILCPDRCLFARDGMPIYMDDDHLNGAGGEIIKAALAPIFANS